MKTIAALSFVVCAGVAFAQQPVAEPAAKPVAKPEAAKAESQPVARKLGLAKPIVMEKDREVYGAQVTMKDEVKLADVLKDPKAFDGKKIKLAAQITGVCQKKGCWMNIKSGEQAAMVKFKDYQFFVPLDVEGRYTTIEAVPQVKVVTEAMRRHYAQDAGKSKEEIEKIKGDETQVIFMAEAVEIRPTLAKKETCCEGEKGCGSCVDDKAGGCCEGEKKADGAKKGEAKGDAKKDAKSEDDCCEGEVNADGSVKKKNDRKVEPAPAKKDG
jgi:hypothetical protein